MKKVVNQKVILISLMFVMLFACSIILIGCESVNTGKINFIVDGQTYSSVETDGFERITLPAEPVKDSYDFAGWYYDDQTFEFVFEETDFIKQQLTVELSLYAKFEPSILRAINYNLDGGVNSPNNVDSLPSGQEFVLSEPTSPNEYLKFGGWFTDSKFETQITTIPKGRESQVDLYAKWVVKDEYGLYVVKSGSMEPALAVGQSVITTSDYQELQVDDIIVFSYSDSSIYICHRIVEINVVEGQTRYTTKGDNNSSVDSRYVIAENILGKVIGVIETPASDDDINMGGEITFTSVPVLWIEATDVCASVSAQVQNSRTEITPFEDEYSASSQGRELFEFPIAFNDNLEPITLTITVTNLDINRSMTACLNFTNQEQSNIVIDITQSDANYTSGEELTFLPQESVTFIVTFTTSVEIEMIKNISFRLTLKELSNL